MGQVAKKIYSSVIFISKWGCLQLVIFIIFICQKIVEKLPLVYEFIRYTVQKSKKSIISSHRELVSGECLTFFSVNNRFFKTVVASRLILCQVHHMMLQLFCKHDVT